MSAEDNFSRMFDWCYCNITKCAYFGNFASPSRYLMLHDDFTQPLVSGWLDCSHYHTFLYKIFIFSISNVYSSVDCAKFWRKLLPKWHHVIISRIWLITSEQGQRGKKCWPIPLTGWYRIWLNVIVLGDMNELINVWMSEVMHIADCVCVRVCVVEPLLSRGQISSAAD